MFDKFDDLKKDLPKTVSQAVDDFINQQRTLRNLKNL
jgi:hypothetical protein